MNRDEILELHRLRDTGLCFADGCTTPRKYTFLCQNHYRQIIRDEYFTPTSAHHTGTDGAECLVNGCSYKRKYKFLCVSHYKKGTPRDWEGLVEAGLV